MKTIVILTLSMYLCSSNISFAQDSSSVNFSKRALSQVNSKVSRAENQLKRRSEKALSLWIRQEIRIRDKLKLSDPEAASRIFDSSLDSMKQMSRALTQKNIPQVNKIVCSNYLDTLTNVFSFLKNNKVNANSGSIGLMNKGSQNLEQLAGKIDYSEKIKVYMLERKKLLIAELNNNLLFARQLRELKQQAFYYSERLRDITESIKDKKKAEAKALEIVRNIPAFQEFMSKHSQFASLFNFGDNAAQSLAGMQTRTQVESLIQERISGSGPNAMALLNQQMDQARSKINDLKEKFPALGNSGEMPDFKPNEMKSKSLIQRLEFGSNIQFQRSNQFYPTTSDLAGQVAYKFHKSGSAGLGLSYKLGMGTGFNDVHFSGQGMGLRSFIDWKLKDTYFLSGGYEQNYQPAYTGVPDGLGQKWTQSALLGMSKKYKINTKVNGNLALLFDFLYNQHIPRTDPVKLRFGYAFK